jgi:hypothetical protein
MSTTALGFGFRLARQPTVHGIARRFPIASGYAANIFSGDPVSLAGTATGEGTIELSTLDGSRTGTIAAMPILGIFAGCEYTDSTGKPIKSAYWPTGTAQLSGTTAWALVYEGDQNEFEVMADGAIALSDIGSQADWSNGSSPYGSTSTGVASCTVSATPIADNSTGGFQIIDFVEDGKNTAGDTYTRVIVRIANPQLGRAARVVENDAGTA